MTKVLIIGPGNSPIPATKGGAVETLIEYIVKENEIDPKIDLAVASIYEEESSKEAKNFKNTKFYQYKVSWFVSLLDRLTCWTAKNILRKKKILAYRYIFQRLHFARYCKRLMKKIPFDKVIMENHVLLLRAFKGKKIQKLYKGKYYYHEHNEIRTDLGCTDVVMNAKKIITVSNYISNSFMNKYPEYNKDNVVKLSNVADISRFGKEYDLSSLKEKYNIKEENKIVLFAGRLDKEKGALEALNAFNMLEDKNARLMIVGSYCYGHKMSNGFEEELYALAEKNKDRIIFTGFIPFDEMPKIYKLADVIVLPSIWNDPAPLSIIEAISSGKCLITTNSGGIREYASECAIVLNRDEELVSNIHKNLVELLNNDSLRLSYEERAKEVTKNWTTNKFFNDFLDIIKD